MMQQKTIWTIGAFTAGVIFTVMFGQYLYTGSCVQKADMIGSSFSSEIKPGATPIGFEVPAAVVMPSVVSIDTLQEQHAIDGQILIAPTSEGSGVILSSDGIIVTNNHVIKNADYVR